MQFYRTDHLTTRCTYPDEPSVAMFSTSYPEATVPTWQLWWCSDLCWTLPSEPSAVQTCTTRWRGSSCWARGCSRIRLCSIARTMLSSIVSPGMKFRSWMHKRKRDGCRAHQLKRLYLQGSWRVPSESNSCRSCDKPQTRRIRIQL